MKNEGKWRSQKRKLKNWEEEEKLKDEGGREGGRTIIGKEGRGRGKWTTKMTLLASRAIQFMANLLGEEGMNYSDNLGGGERQSPIRQCC
jgi:hypothetical protein